MQRLLKSCCGCCPLKVGVVIIGLLDIFQRIPLFFSFYLTVSYLPMLITSLVLTGIGAILTILLLVGAFKYKKWFLLPWMIEKAIHCLITLISTILIPIFSPLVIRMFLQKNEKNSLNELGVIAIIFSIEVISFISVGLDIYFFSVVLSFFFELKLEEEREKFVKNVKERAT